MTGSEPKAMEDLEAQIAYTEKMLNDLSDVVVSQGQEIDRLKAEIEILGRQILQLTEGEAGSH
ncbi:SlyX family protein [Pelagibius marinus]|uniref:SlyX family protein n=1 Tax=Pelagibius marinus TaxID=2762760 RepID=UPI0018728FDE|nr:SlyX family protein [Pelagibius marinus]